MDLKAVGAGLKRYLGSLVATLLFPILWMRALRLARRHSDDDPRARAKVLVAIVASIAIGLGGAYVLLGVQAAATDGFYDSMDARLATALGESEYAGYVETESSKPGTIQTIEGNIARESAAGNDTAVLEEALAVARSELASATENRTAMEPNHALYLQVHAAVQDKDDQRIRDLIAATPLARPDGIQAGVDEAFAVKARAANQFEGWMWVFFWPSLAGAFYAPLAFAFGSILKASFVPSDSVGFKPYPGAAAGLFLLFGAFGLPAIPFAAWTFLDAESRSVEGQIAL